MEKPIDAPEAPPVEAPPVEAPPVEAHPPEAPGEEGAAVIRLERPEPAHRDEKIHRAAAADLARGRELAEVAEPAAEPAGGLVEQPAGGLGLAWIVVPIVVLILAGLAGLAFVLARARKKREAGK